MNTKERILRVVAVVIMLAEIVGCMSSREDRPVETKNCLWKYRKDASGVVITGHLDKTIVNLIIPETIEGMTVIGIERWALACRKALETVVIPESVKTIGEHAFYGCSLRNVEMHEGLLKIDELAFSACHPLKSVSIPKSVVSIGLEAFPSWCEIKGEGDVVIKAEHDRLICKKLEDAAREEEARWQQKCAEREKTRKAEVWK